MTSVAGRRCVPQVDEGHAGRRRVPAITSRARLGPASTPMVCRVVAEQRVGDHLGHPLAGDGFEALGHADHHGVRVDRSAAAVSTVPDVRGRDGDDDHVSVGDRIVRSSGDGELRRQPEPGQERDVLAAVVDGVHDGGFARPEGGRHVLAGERGKGGPPRSGADDR